MNEVNRCPKRDIESAISLDDIIVEPRYVRWISFHMSSGEKFQRDNKIEKKKKNIQKLTLTNQIAVFVENIFLPDSQEMKFSCCIIQEIHSTYLGTSA